MTYESELEAQLEELLNIMNIGSAGQLIKFCNSKKHLQSVLLSKPSLISQVSFPV